MTLDDIAEIRAGIAQALGSLKQQPSVIDDIGLHARMLREIKKHGSMAAAARAWGVPRQEVFAVLNSDRTCPPRLLAKLVDSRHGS